MAPGDPADFTAQQLVCTGLPCGYYSGSVLDLYGMRVPVRMFLEIVLWLGAIVALSRRALRLVNR